MKRNYHLHDFFLLSLLMLDILIVAAYILDRRILLTVIMNSGYAI